MIINLGKYKLYSRKYGTNIVVSILDDVDYSDESNELLKITIGDKYVKLDIENTFYYHVQENGISLKPTMIGCNILIGCHGEHGFTLFYIHHNYLLELINDKTDPNNILGINDENIGGLVGYIRELDFKLNKCKNYKYDSSAEELEDISVERMSLYWHQVKSIDDERCILTDIDGHRFITSGATYKRVQLLNYNVTSVRKPLIKSINAMINASVQPMKSALKA